MQQLLFKFKVMKTKVNLYCQNKMYYLKILILDKKKSHKGLNTVFQWYG